MNSPATLRCEACGQALPVADAACACTQRYEDAASDAAARQQLLQQQQTTGRYICPACGKRFDRDGLHLAVAEQPPSRRFLAGSGAACPHCATALTLQPPAAIWQWLGAGLLLFLAVPAMMFVSNADLRRGMYLTAVTGIFAVNLLGSWRRRNDPHAYCRARAN